MANLENNNDKNKKSVTQNIEDSVQKSVGSVQKTAKEVADFAKDAIENPVETAGEFMEQAAKDVVSVKWWVKLLQVFFWTVLFIAGSIFLIINLPVTKNWAAQKVIHILNEDLKSQIAFDSIDINYFGDVTIHNVSAVDYKKYKFLKAKKVYADSDWFSIIFNSRNIKFQSISMDELDLKVITYKGDSISNFIHFVDLFDDGKPSKNKDPFRLKSRISLTNSKVSIVNQNLEGEQGKWLDAENLNLTVPELRIKGPEIFAQINNLRFITKRWGKKHTVETLTADLTLNKKFLSLEDLTINTDHTLLQGGLKFNLNEGKWSDFSNRVKWEMNLKQGSQISGYDISYFVANWDNYKPVNISGKMDGPLNGFTLNNFVLGNKEVSVRTDKMAINRILDGDFKIESNSISTDFTYVALKGMLPTFISSKMKNFADDFGRLKYSGSASVTPHQITVSAGNLISGIGQAKIQNLHLTDYSSSLPKYQGFVEVNNLNVAAITKNKQVGLVSGKFDLKGESFDLNTMHLSTKSQISRIEILDKILKNIYLDGVLNRKTYKGLVTINDEQAKAKIDGFIDFSTPRLKADITSNIDHLNINYFTETKGKQLVSGKLNGKIAMTNLNDMNLDADLNHLVFTDGSRRYEIPNGNVKAFFENGQRIIAVDAPKAVEGRIEGRFNLADIAGMLQNGFNKVLVSPKPRKLYNGQNFNLDFQVESGLLGYFVPDLKAPKGIKAFGSYEGTSNDLILNVDAQNLKYYLTKKEEIKAVDDALASSDTDYKQNHRFNISRDSVMVDSVMVRINTANLEEQVYARINRAEYNQNVLKNILFSSRNENNEILHIAAKFSHGTPEEEKDNKLKDYAVNLAQTTNPAGDFIFHFEPTEIKFNDVKWEIDTNPELNHYITYRKTEKDFIVHNLKIKSDESTLLVKDALFKSVENFTVDAEVSNLEISKVFDILKADNSMDIKGIANGSVKITMNKKNIEPLIDMTVKDIMMNGTEMGDLIVEAKKSDHLNVFDVDAKIKSKNILGNNNLHLTGTVDNNPSLPVLDLKMDLDDFNLAFTQEFVKTVFGNMRGKANGVMKITGPVNDIDYSGNIALKGVGLKLNFTGVDYSFDDTTLELSKGFAELPITVIRDGRANSSGTVSGIIRFETISRMNVLLYFKANNLLVLNTTQKDFDLFWGTIYGKGDLYISGPVSGLSIETSKQDPFRALNNSVFTFNSNSKSNVDKFKMLRFLKEDQSGAVIHEEKTNSGNNMNVDFNLAVDKGTLVNVLVGDDIGDISVRGNSDNLNFHMDRRGNISMEGSYLVENGTFTSKAFLNRTFQIEKGSNIRWDGNAMSPALAITANYMRAVSNTGKYLNMSLQPVNILLQAKLSQTLTEPKIDFDITAIDVASSVKEMLASKMSNDDEKVLQFGSILTLNSFNIADSGGLAAMNVGSAAEDMGVNFLFKQLGSVLNTISSDVQVDLNYVKGDNFSGSGDRANAGVKVAVSPRVTVKTGLGIPVSKTDASVNKEVMSGEGSIEYDVSKNNDGTLVFRAYSKPTNIGMGNTTNSSANQTYGLGVAWTKSFDTLFKRKKKKTRNADKVKEQAVENDSIKK